MRSVVLLRFAWRRYQAVAHDDLFLRGFNTHCRNVGEALDATRPEKLVFVAEHRAAVVDQPFAGTVDEPEIAGVGIDTGDVDAVAHPAHNPIVATCDDLGRVGESVRTGDQRPRQKGFDVAGWDHRNGLRLDRAYANRRRDAHRLASSQRQARLTRHVIEDDRVARIDP